MVNYIIKVDINQKVELCSHNKGFFHKCIKYNSICYKYNSIYNKL